MKKNYCDVLVMIYGMIGRDAEALIPIIYVLKNKYNLNVKIRSIFDFTAIDILKPKVLLTNGCNGSIYTHLVTKYAYEKGIYTVSLHAEGMFREDNIHNHVIGWNQDEKPTVNKWYFWNKNAYDLAVSYYPQFKSVLDVAGSTLHEKYLIFDKADFYGKLSDSYKKYDYVFFYVGSSFDCFHQWYKENKIDNDPNIYRDRVVKYLRLIAEKFPNILLILKYHPACQDESVSEIDGYFKNLENVDVVHKEFQVFELVNISDIVFSFDSTTMIDAWLSGKHTINFYDGKKSIFLNKSRGYSSIRKGSLIPKNEQDLLNYIDEYIRNGKIEAFASKDKVRRRVINNYVGKLDEKPSLKIATHINDKINESLVSESEKEIVGLNNMIFLLKGLVNKFFYFMPFPSIFPFTKFFKMKDYYIKDKFVEQYKKFEPKLKKYYGF